MTVNNKAAWLKEAKANPLTIDNAPTPVPGPDQVVIENKAVAVNPVDWLMQDQGFFIKEYPVTLGTDVAGIVHEVGSNVKHVAKGDRVLGHAIGLTTGKPEDNAFQLYTRCSGLAVAKIPKDTPFTHATVLPLAISTASAALYQPGYLELPYPSIPAKATDKLILVWGGASSVGSTAIQLAVASGVTVITTASQRNHAHCTALGAAAVLDYASDTVVSDVLAAIQKEGKVFAGVFDAISKKPSFEHVFPIVQKAGGSNKVATVLPPPDDRPADVDAKGVLAPSIVTEQPQVAKAVWRDFVPRALEEGVLKCVPEPQVVGRGLESVQKGIDAQKKGVSARKIVVEL